MIDKRANDFGCICGIVRKHIDRAVWKAGFLEHRADEPMDSRTGLRGFEHYGIAARKRNRKRSDAEDDRSVRLHGFILAAFSLSFNVKI
jgi:hypothetical protein